MMSKRLMKIIIVLVLVVLIVGFFAGRYLWSWYQAQKLLQWHEEQIEILRQDVYGGETPEQTWQMFLSALQKEDLDLASKYFVLEEQEEWRENLLRTKEAGDLPALIEDITIGPWQEVILGEELAEYEIKDLNEETTAYIIMEKNINNKWKIRSF